MTLIQRLDILLCIQIQLYSVFAVLVAVQPIHHLIYSDMYCSQQRTSTIDTWFIGLDYQSIPSESETYCSCLDGVNGLKCSQPLGNHHQQAFLRNYS